MSETMWLRAKTTFMAGSTAAAGLRHRGDVFKATKGEGKELLLLGHVEEAEAPPPAEEQKAPAKPVKKAGAAS